LVYGLGLHSPLPNAMRRGREGRVADLAIQILGFRRYFLS
jgi:hypothetical protein